MPERVSAARQSHASGLAWRAVQARARSRVAQASIEPSAKRAKVAGATTRAETIEAANEQTSALSRLLVVVENYPQLKSDANFQRLMDELAGTENRIAVARGRYNERIQEYNTTRRRFPSNVTAKIFGFGEYPYFEAPKDAQQAPKVNFGNK